MQHIIAFNPMGNFKRNGCEDQAHKKQQFKNKFVVCDNNSLRLQVSDIFWSLKYIKETRLIVSVSITTQQYAILRMCD